MCLHLICMVHTDSLFCCSQGKTWLAFLEGHYSKPFWPFVLFFLIQTFLPGLGEGDSIKKPPNHCFSLSSSSGQVKGPGSVWGMGEVLGFGRTVMGGKMSLSLEAGMGRNQLSLGLSPFLQFLNLGQQGSITPHPIPI